MRLGRLSKCTFQLCRVGACIVQNIPEQPGNSICLGGGSFRALYDRFKIHADICAWVFSKSA